MLDELTPEEEALLASGIGSDPEIREDEKVCSVTGYTYYHLLDKSPHVDEFGVMTW